MQDKPHIVTDPNIAFGKPTIAGTRITVEQIVEELAAGLTVDDIIEQHDLSREAIQAAFKYIVTLVEQVATPAASHPYGNFGSGRTKQTGDRDISAVW